MFRASQHCVEFSGKIINCLNTVPNKISIFVKEWKDGDFQVEENFNGILAVEIFGYKST